jgi:hypothetical protein
MPIAVTTVITFGIMAIRRGVDWPLAVVAMVLGDRSNGTILEEPVNMAGNVLDKIWQIAVSVFSGGDKTNPAAMAQFGMHVAQTIGVAG